MTLKQRIQIERDIGEKIIDDALAAGYTISVYDSAEWTVKNSRDRAEIVAALMTTDDDILRFSDAEGKTIGSVWLVYGNSGWDVICDSSTNDPTQALLAGAEQLAETFEHKYPEGETC